MRRDAVVALFLVFGLAVARAEPPPVEAELPRIEVEGKGGRKVFPYKALQAGRAHFESRRQELTPQGQLRFELVGRKAGAQPLVSTASAETLLALDSQRHFELPQLPAAEAADAELWFDRDPKADGWFSPRVLSPGLGERERRLGDLHLECELEIAIVKAIARWWQRAFIATFEQVAACNRDLPRGVQRAWISHGERRMDLPLMSTQKRSITLPKLKDWPADSVIAWSIALAEPASAARP